MTTVMGAEGVVLQQVHPHLPRKGDVRSFWGPDGRPIDSLFERKPSHDASHPFEYPNVAALA
jgi:hypothetical protein